MANEKPTDFTTLQPGAVRDGDWLVGVDLSDTTDSAGGSDAKIPGWALPRLAALGSDATANSTTTAAKITGLDTLADPGTYVFQFFIRYVTSATGTGVKFSANHTGTLSTFVANLRYVSTGGAAATAAATQAGNTATGNLMESFSARAKSTAAGMGPTVSADTTGDMLIILEGLMIVTATGNLELYHASETAASTTVKQGSSLILQRTL